MKKVSCMFSALIAESVASVYTNNLDGLNIGLGYWAAGNIGWLVKVCKSTYKTYKNQEAA